MVLRSWLASVFGRLKVSSARARSRKRRTIQSSATHVVEMLEQRKMLTALVVTSNSGSNQFLINEEYSISPYPTDSTPVGTQVAKIFVFDPNTAATTTPPIPVYNVGNTVISGGNTNNAFRMGVANNTDVIQVWNPYALDAAVTPSFTLLLTSTDTLGNTGTINVTINLIPHTVQYLNQTVSERLPVVPQYPYGQNLYGDGSGASSGQLGPIFPYSTSIPADSISQGGDDNTSSPSTYPGIPAGAPLNGALAISHAGANVLHVAANSAVGTVVGKVTAVSPDSNLFTSNLTYSFVGNVPGKDSTHPAFSIDPFTGTIKVLDQSYLNFEARAIPNSQAPNEVGNLGQGGLKINVSPPYQDVVFAVQVRATDAVGAFSQTSVPDSLVNASTGKPINGDPVGSSGSKQTDTFLFIRMLDVGKTLPTLVNATTNLSVTETAKNADSVGYFNMDNRPSSTPGYIPNYFTPAGGSVRVASAGFNSLQPQERMSYSIIGGNTGGAFAINPDTGEVTVNNAAALSYLTQNSYNLQIKITTDNPDADVLGYAQNVAPLSETANLHITVNPGVLPVTVAPSFTFSIPEASKDGTFVGKVVATDLDTQVPPSAGGPGVLSYSFLSGNTITIGGVTYGGNVGDPFNQGIFAIDSSGNITVKNNVPGQTNAAVLDYLNQNAFSLSVLVTNTFKGQTTTGNTVVNINLTKIDTTAPVITPGSATIAERSANGTVVGQVNAKAGQSDFSIASYAIISGNLGNAFAIDAIGQITVNNSSALNYYGPNGLPNNPFTLGIKVVDNGTPSPLTATSTFTVNLTQVNLPLSMSNQSFKVNEYTPFLNAGTTVGTQVGKVLISDPDNPPVAPTGQTFTIDGGNFGIGSSVGAFSIDNNGNITVADPTQLVYDINPTFSLIVTVHEAGVPSYATTATMTVTITQQQDAPVLSAQVFNGLPEHSLSGVTVGNVIASARDNLGGPLVYSITGGTPASATSAFAIDPNTGKITVVDPHLIDYSKTPQFKLNITATDTTGSIYSTTVTDTINLTPTTSLTPSVASPPKLIQNLSLPLNEFSPNLTAVITDSATGGTGPYTYSIISGNTQNAFAISSAGVISVNNSAALNYVKNPVFNLKIQVTDSSTPVLGDTATVTINLKQVDVKPSLINLESNDLVYVQNTSTYTTPAVYNILPVTSTIIAISPEVNAASTATVSISNNYQAGQDQLVYNPAKPIGNITVDLVNSTPQTLILKGVDSFTNYRYALQAVQFQNTSYNPSTAVRTVSFQITDSNVGVNAIDGQGVLTSSIVSRKIDVIHVNSQPHLSPVSTLASYTEGNTPVAINPGIVVQDADDGTLANATVTITNYVAGEDQLAFVNNGSTMGDITVAGNANGILSLTSPSGTATIANWQAALSAVTYANTSGDLNPISPTITFTVDDGHAVNNISNTVTTTVTTTPLFPPVLSVPVPYTLQYTEGATAAIIQPQITVTSPSNVNITSATVTINDYTVGDVITYNPNPNSTPVVAVVNGGVVSLSLPAGKTATANQWASALEGVDYYNNSLTYNASLTRSVSFQVNTGGALNPLSNVLTASINITPVKHSPQILNLETIDVGYTQGTPVKITNAITVSDIDSINLTQATVTISQGYVAGQDFLNFTNTSAITGSFVNGTLTLTGSDSIANYQAALQSITFSTGNNPGKGQRAVTFNVIDDGGKASINTPTRYIDVTPVYALPVLSNIETTTLQYNQDPAPTYVNNITPISNTIQVSDVDSLVLTGATIQILGNYAPFQDFLVFNNTNNITSSWDGKNGTLTLSGQDTLANYAAALQSVSYLNKADNPSLLTRNVVYTVTVNHGYPNPSYPVQTSLPVSRAIQVNHTNKPPVLTAVDTTPLSFTENTAPVVIAPNILATDANSNTITGATIQITGNYNAGQSIDTLAFTNTSKITGSWNATTGTLTLTGNDTVSNYRTALRSITFANNQDAVTAPQRTVSFTITDDNPLISNTVTRNINIATVNQAPVLSGIESNPVIYKINDPNTTNARSITSTTVVTDYDSPNLRFASIKITGNYVPGEDQLVIDSSVVGSLKDGVAWNSATGELTLSGLASQSVYLKAITGIVYLNHAATPTTTPRTVSIQVFDDQLAPSNVVARSVSFSAINIPPFVSINAGSPLVYAEQSAAAPVAPALTVVDPDSPNLVSATVAITAGYIQGQDSLVFANTPYIQGSWNASTGVLTLNGVDSQANYQAALESVKYYNSSNNPNNSTRTVSFAVSDGLSLSNAANQQINVQGINIPPIIATNSNGPVSYSQGNSTNPNSVAVVPGFTALDPESNNLTKVTIAITPGTYQKGNDVLSFVNTSTIKGSFDAQTGTLTLTGADSVSNYRAAIRTVTYQFTNANAIVSTKTISLQVLDGINFSNTVMQDILVNP
jgi:Cadherin domain